MALDSFSRAFAAWRPSGPSDYLAVSALLLLPFLLTYTLTYIKGYWIKTTRSKHGGREPPPAPYAIPGLANTIGFARDPEGYLRRMLKRFGEVPFRLIVGPYRFYHIPPGDLLLQLFRASRDLTAKPLTVMAMRDQFGLPEEDMNVIYRDDSGINAKPLEGFENMDPKHRLMHNNHRDLHNLLSGSALDVMTARFVEIYSDQTRESQVVPKSQSSNKEWTQLPDLYEFLRDEMFQAACTALLGDHFFRLNPNFSSVFWEFDRNVMAYTRRLPRWLARRAYQVRDETIEALVRWRDHASEHYPIHGPEETKAEWEPFWGAKLMRAREIMLNDLAVSKTGKAVFDLGMLWATNANVIPSAFWALRAIIATPGLTERVLAETSSCFDEETGGVDIAALCSKPLLTSIYLEALRFSVGVTPARNLLVPSIELGPWKFERGSTLIANNWFGSRALGFWNTGRDLDSGKPEHPVDSFWAERWLEYPDDPASGPLRKPDASLYRAATKPRTIEDDANAKVVTTGTAGYFFPYGGGTKICPGRFFAKQEMMSAVAVFLREFEFELVDKEAADRIELDMSYFPAGSLPPKGKTAVRIRRRER
ncbi:cytochrome P450 [Cercophora newfieldiana]|uniref:Cytochrome P450 n=1 Tax=Cercophora newfieldiana TaxID=92897 RepID=A0AA39YA74_9PEZI|nr:cytochrome P450 [Cercophora newfieldiana]